MWRHHGDTMYDLPHSPDLWPTLEFSNGNGGYRRCEPRNNLLLHHYTKLKFICVNGLLWLKIFPTYFYDSICLRIDVLLFFFFVSTYKKNMWSDCMVIQARNMIVTPSHLSFQVCLFTFFVKIHYNNKVPLAQRFYQQFLFKCDLEAFSYSSDGCDLNIPLSHVSKLKLPKLKKKSRLTIYVVRNNML